MHTPRLARFAAALLLALERLSPLERAAFLLHDVFDMEFARVAEVLERSEAACRQLAARARAHVQESRPRFTVSREDSTRLAEAFLTATRTGDAQALTRLLARDAVLHSDGGGKRPAALRPIAGRFCCAGGGSQQQKRAHLAIRRRKTDCRLRAGFRRIHRRRILRRCRQRNQRPRDGAAGRGGSSRARRDRAGEHVHRDCRGGRTRRSQAGTGRRRPSLRHG